MKHFLMTKVCNNIRVIGLIYVLSIIIASVLFSVVESKSIHDALWWSVVTSLTIGYGDIAPVTFLGRAVGVVFGHFWVFGVIPMIVANILMNIIEDKNEFTHSEQEQMKKDLAMIVTYIRNEQGDLK